MKHIWTILLLCILVGLMIRVEEVKAEAKPGKPSVRTM